MTKDVRVSAIFEQHYGIGRSVFGLRVNQGLSKAIGLNYTHQLIDWLARVLEKPFELNIGPISSTEPQGIAFFVYAMIELIVRNFSHDHPIENFKSAFVLIFCSRILVGASKHLLDDVSVDFAIFKN